MLLRLALLEASSRDAVAQAGPGGAIGADGGLPRGLEEARRSQLEWVAQSARLAHCEQLAHCFRVRDLIILKTGVTIPEIAARRGDFDVWIAAGLGRDLAGIHVVSVFEGETPPAPSAELAVVVTGSSAMVSEREAWSEAAAVWLRDAVAVGAPVLGICYGHQLLAHGLGGRVTANPNGREIGSVEVMPTAAGAQDPLLGAATDSFIAQTTHVESVEQLPPGATLLASTSLDPNHAFRFGESAWGVQFHPEFDADIVRGYLSDRRPVLESEGFDVDRLNRDVVEAPRAAGVLARFAQLLED